MIKATVIQDSIYRNKRITTYELEYPRFIHGEFMTHRVFSRNAASSRAIPIKTMNELISNNPAKPVHWGKNQSGMQAKEELDFASRTLVENEWDSACQDAVRHSKTMEFLGAHKQICNRITEPFQVIKVVMTTTEDSNWFWLRDHTDAQPEIMTLAKAMLEAKQNSTPMEIGYGEWHLPYIDRKRVDGELKYYTLDGNPIGLNDALAVSASCCAQVSYRKLDDTLEKATKIFKQLIESKPCHASPCEHQATPIEYCRMEERMVPIERPKTFVKQSNTTMLCKRNVVINHPRFFDTWEPGITHVDSNYQLWSGNFKGWIQHRQLIPENALM